MNRNFGALHPAFIRYPISIVMRCDADRSAFDFDSRNCCPTRDSPSRLQYTASLTAELNIDNADSECQNCIDCTNWRTNLPHFSYLAARSDAMVPNRLVGIGIQCLPRMPAHGHNSFSCLARKLRSQHCRYLILQLGTRCTAID